ncbi:F0F1 ATP synthase subunit B family protein [Sandaracinobacteroides hominis]|uniref:F0F1 ATP synthase subunit B family protein n=1 Tax=Sandaracinobacteroides hominis TaxID=2780086 RepID=UPI0018F387D6|nr:ATPase [Sandaracinobacteroides hominis]
MPQFDFTQALPQVLWLALVFGILYLCVRGMVPRVQKVVENRKARIASDLREAEAARDAAEAASSGGTTALADARARSLAVTGKARDLAASQTAAKLASVDEELKLHSERAAVALADTRTSTIAELDAVASEATVELVKRVAGLDVSADEAAKAVKKVAA